jgi:hypothetical protein
MLRSAFLAAAVLSLGACVPTTPSYHLVAPADPYAGVRGPAYATVTAGVKNFDVTGPKDWRELNREVAPGGGEGAENRGVDTTVRARRGR